jgi:hypothetical protein
MSDDRHDVFATARDACRRLLRDYPNRKVFKVTMQRGTIELFHEWLQSTDPDMPPPPVCKALGPLVGDIMTSEKLQRLDALADVLGPLVIRLEMMMERHDG